MRGLIDHITLHPETDGYRMEVRGKLAAIFGLAGSGSANDKGPSVSADALGVRVKLVAGTGFEPVTFRL